MLTLHIGIGKTATTSLQQIFFPHHDQILYLGKKAVATVQERALKESIDSIMLSDTLTYSPKPGRAMATAFVEQAKRENKIALYSDEKILGLDSDKGCILQRLYETFAPCKIIFSIREQRSLLRSLYGHTNNKLKNLPRPCNGKFICIEDWLEYHLTLMRRQKGWLWLGQYAPIAQRLVELFGKENVCILPFEHFCSDRTAYLHAMCSFLDISYDAELDANLGTKRLNTCSADRWFQKQHFMYTLKRTGHPLAKSSTLLRAAGALYSNFNRNPKPITITIPEEWDEILTGIFQETNQSLAQDYGLPLKEYGYSL